MRSTAERAGRPLPDAAELSLVVSSGGRWPCVFASRGSRRVFQRPPSELERQCLLDLVHEGDVQQLLVSLLRPPSSPESEVLHLRVARADGTYPWFEVRVQRPVQGQTRVVVLAFREIPTVRTSALSHLVRQVVSDGFLALEYQPVVRLLDDVVVGAEALVRVRDGRGRGGGDSGGDSAASQALLDAAVRAGVIADVDARLLDLVALEQAACPETRPVPVVSLNLTGPAIEDGRICRRLLATRSAGTAGSSGQPSLQVELSERALLTASPVALERLHELHEAGIRLGVDDFGADAVSLSLLWRLPLDYVKVHPSVMAQAGSVRAARALLQSIVDMAHSLDLTVVAQGIATHHERVLALQAACDEGQGPLWPARATLTDLNAVPERNGRLSVVS